MVVESLSPVAGRLHRVVVLADRRHGERKSLLLLAERGFISAFPEWLFLTQPLTCRQLDMIREHPLAEARAFRSDLLGASGARLETFAVKLWNFPDFLLASRQLRCNGKSGFFPREALGTQLPSDLVASPFFL